MDPSNSIGGTGLDGLIEAVLDVIFGESLLQSFLMLPSKPSAVSASFCALEQMVFLKIGVTKVGFFFTD